MPTDPMNPATAVTWGPFIQAAFDQYASDPGQINPAAIKNMPAGYTLVRTIQMSDFLGPQQSRAFYGFIAVGGDPKTAVVAVRGTVKGHRDFPVGGQLISLRVDRLCPCRRSADLPAGPVSGVTPFPAVASARRRLVPSLRMRWAWCSSRSTVAVARVLGVIVSSPLGCRFEVTIRDRRSYAASASR